MAHALDSGACRGSGQLWPNVLARRWRRPRCAEGQSIRDNDVEVRFGRAEAPRECGYRDGKQEGTRCMAGALQRSPDGLRAREGIEGAEPTSSDDLDEDAGIDAALASSSECQRGVR